MAAPARALFFKEKVGFETEQGREHQAWSLQLNDSLQLHSDNMKVNQSPHDFSIQGDISPVPGSWSKNLKLELRQRGTGRYKKP